MRGVVQAFSASAVIGAAPPGPRIAASIALKIEVRSCATQRRIIGFP